VDLSALGRGDDQLTPMPVAGWARVDTDRMRLKYERVSILPGHSLPRFAGEPVQFDGYVDVVVQGFAQTYEFLLRFRDELLAPQGPLAAFKGRPVRRVFRDTLIYGLTLDASYHPRFQTDAIACEAMLRDALRATFDESLPWLRHLEDAEVADLLACDIPYFSSMAGRTEISELGAQPPSALSGDTWPYHRAQIETMSARDLERQVSLIRVAMHNSSTKIRVVLTDAVESLAAPSSQELISTAASIGDRICDLAIEDGDRCTWLTTEIVNSRRIAPSVAGLDLYDGLPGIALFLGHLGIVTGDARYGRMANGAMREALALYRKQSVASMNLGAFDGIGGLCYALVHLASATNQHDLATEAAAIIGKFAKRAARSNNLDVHSGLAGFVIAGLVVSRFSGNAGLTESLRPSVERLWRLLGPRPIKSTARLPENHAGLSHGEAGAGFALLRWAEATGEAHYRAAGEGLVRKDFAKREFLRRSSSLVENANSLIDPLGWCKGSLGIAMAALGAAPSMMDLFEENWPKEITEAIVNDRTTGCLCLCHGVLGRLEFLTLAAQRRIIDEQAKEIEDWRRNLLCEMAGGRWFADATHTLESPGLMLGLAGTGYSLLRAAFGDRIPSVLVLEDAVAYRGANAISAHCTYPVAAGSRRRRSSG
jgi:type 2 lantibiotic biosynthesis protein LanM